MASKKTIELKEFSNEELKNELTQTEAQYRKLRFDHAIKGMDNPIVLREVRRDIARLNTEIRKRELDALSKEELGNRSKIRARRKRQKKSN